MFGLVIMEPVWVVKQPLTVSYSSWTIAILQNIFTLRDEGGKVRSIIVIQLNNDRLLGMTLHLAVVIGLLAGAGI